MPLRFAAELRADVLFARAVLAAPLLGLAVAGLADLRAEADFAPAVLAAVTLAPEAFAPALLAALLAVLRAVLRVPDAGFAALLARVLRELAADFAAPRVLPLRALLARALPVRALLLRALLARALPVRALLPLRALLARDDVLAGERDDLAVVLTPGVIDLANCSMSLITERLVDFASRRSVRRASARSLYALFAFLPKAARTLWSAAVASSSAFSKRAVAASTS